MNKGNEKDKIIKYTDTDRFIEYIFTSGRPELIDRVIELERRKKYETKT